MFFDIQRLVFVKRDIYGQNVERRYSDYSRSVGDNFLHEESLLPNPFNEGEEWYTKAVAVIKADLTRPDDYKAWKAHWEKYSVFREKREEFEQITENARSIEMRLKSSLY
jgi:hypothetical protein